MHGISFTSPQPIKQQSTLDISELQYFQISRYSCITRNYFSFFPSAGSNAGNSSQLDDSLPPVSLFFPQVLSLSRDPSCCKEGCGQNSSWVEEKSKLKATEKSSQNSVKKSKFTIQEKSSWKRIEKSKFTTAVEKSASQHSENCWRGFSASRESLYTSHVIISPPPPSAD